MGARFCTCAGFRHLATGFVYVHVRMRLLFVPDYMDTGSRTPERE